MSEAKKGRNQKSVIDTGKRMKGGMLLILFIALLQKPICVMLFNNKNRRVQKVSCDTNFLVSIKCVYDFKTRHRLGSVYQFCTNQR